MNKKLTIKTADRNEIDIAVEWAAHEGWNPGLNDAACYHTADPGGFLIGYLDDEPIATISAVKYGVGFGFLGFYIVKETYRHQGFGIQIWDAAMKSMAGRNIGLDGVVDQQENYKKSGFKLAYRNIRHEGITGLYSAMDNQIVDLSEIPFAQVDDYDKVFFADERSGFIEQWIKQPDSAALGIVDNGNLCGYGVIRPCRSGFKIGPLFADSPQQAETLFHALSSKVTAGRPLFLDTPEVNRAAVSLAENNGMQMVFETARMYTGDTPALPHNKTFGVTSFEVG